MQDTPHLSRREFVQASGAIVGLSALPDFEHTIGGRGGFTPLANAMPDEIQTFGSNADPSFVLWYEPAEDGTLPTGLDSWLSEHDDEVTVLREFATLDALVVRMPWDTAGKQTFGALSRVNGGAQAHADVTYLDANVALDNLVDPIEELAGESIHGFDLRARDRASAVVAGVSDPGPDGIAFDADAPEASLRQAREIVNAPADLITGVDTSGVIGCAIDTGVNAGAMFEDADGNSRLHPESTNWTSVDDPTIAVEGPDAVADGADSRHGTWVSACGVSNSDDDRYLGYAPDAELLGHKALDDDGAGATEDILAALDHAIDLAGVHDVCMSLGSFTWSQAIADALERAAEEDVFVAVAVGNDRYATTFVNSPASADDGVGVQACNVPESGERDDTMPAYFGNVGPAPGTGDFSGGESEGSTPQIAAPGMNVRVGIPSGTKVLSGTSMAGPHLWGMGMQLTARGITDVETKVERLTETAYPAPNFGTTEAEVGLADLQAAVDNTPYEDDLEDVQTDEAVARDEFNDWYAEARFRRLAGLF